MQSTALTESIEWLEPDGLGGFASGTAVGRRTRRYHALLLSAVTPPTGRFVLVNGFEAWVETSAGRFALTSQRYVSNAVYPDGQERLRAFVDEPWPTWRWGVPPDNEVSLELFVPHERSACVLTWKVSGAPTVARLYVRPFLSGRNYHALHRENGAIRFAADCQPGAVTWKPYDGVPATTALSNGVYRHEPDWFRNFLYVRERDRGLDDVEDLASPGTFRFDSADGAVLIFAAEGHVDGVRRIGPSARAIAEGLRTAERARRATFATRLDRSVDAYIVRRGAARTIIAGYPWFTDWGRDTFIALRGLCLATGRLDDARDILMAWSSTISQGMLPNRFPDTGESLEFNSVDASLWYVVAIHDFLNACRGADRPASPSVEGPLREAVRQILEGYAAGTRFGIRCDADGLLAAGEPGMQLTWMDAKVGGRPITPRVGKPVEVQALWLAALRAGSRFDPKWRAAHDRALAQFRARFWNESLGCLYDVVDVDHKAGTVDASVRPNQIFAVGGLPWNFLDASAARRVVDVVESRLLVPIGLRTLAPGSPGYAGTITGGPTERDSVYHQGTVWPWLIGPFAEAWLRVRNRSAESRQIARSRFVAPLLGHLAVAGLNHVSEIADGDAPHMPRGCPFQAWSLGELMRMVRCMLDDQTA